MSRRSVPGIQDRQELEIEPERDRAIEGALRLGKQVGPGATVFLEGEEIEIVPEISETELWNIEDERDQDRQERGPAPGGSGLCGLAATCFRPPLGFPTPLAVPAHGAAV